MKRIVLSTLFALMTLAFNSVAFANPVANLELSCTDGFITANVTIGGPTEGSTLTLTLDPGGETTTIPIENGQGSYSYTFTTPAESGTEYTVTATADDSVTKAIEGCTTTEPTPEVTPVTPDPTVEPTPDVTPETPTPVTPTPEVTPTPGDDEPGTLVISKFECTQIEEPTATVSDPVGVGAAADAPAPEEGCVPDAADFQIFVNGDFTSEPIDVFVDGTATVNGVPSTAATGVPNALFEPAFNVFFEFEITPGGVTTITVLNPADDGDGTTPIADGDDDGTGDDGTDDGAGDDGADDGTNDGAGDDGTNDGAGNDGTGDDGTNDGAGNDGTGDDGTNDGAGDDGADDGTNDGTDEGAGDDGADDGTDDGTDHGAVSALPSTGQGSDGGANGSASVLLFGAMSMVALAAGVAWRQRRMI